MRVNGGRGRQMTGPVLALAGYPLLAAAIVAAPLESVSALTAIAHDPGAAAVAAASAAAGVALALSVAAFELGRRQRRSQPGARAAHRLAETLTVLGDPGRTLAIVALGFAMGAGALSPLIGGWAWPPAVGAASGVAAVEALAWLLVCWRGPAARMRARHGALIDAVEAGAALDAARIELVADPAVIVARARARGARVQWSRRGEQERYVVSAGPRLYVCTLGSSGGAPVRGARAPVTLTPARSRGQLPGRRRAA